MDKTCPYCGSPMLMLYGYGWDYDKLVCSSKTCVGEYELKTSTFPPLEN